MSERDDLFGDDSPEEKKPLKEEGEEEFFFDLDEGELEEEDSRQAATDEAEDFLASEDPSPADTGDAIAAGERAEEQAPIQPDKKGGGSRSKLLVLLLLILALVGVGYFYLGDMLFMPEPEPARQVVKSQPQKIKVPERKPDTREQSAVKEEVMPAEKVASAPAEKPAEQPPPAATEGEPVEASESQAGAEAQPVPAAAATETDEKVMETAARPEEQEPAAAVKEEAAAEPEKEVAEAPQPVTAAVAPYTLQIGAYVLESNLNETVETVESLGYQPRILEGSKDVVMTRLKVGTFPPDEARQKLQELKPVAPGAFLLKDADQLTLYAGSYYITDRARVQADRLYQHEILVDEIKVDIAVPIKTVRFGSFATRAEAEQALEQAVRAGLEALVIKQN